MKNTSPKEAADLIFDDVVIHFNRQSFYPEVLAFQVTIHSSPIHLPGGAFKVEKKRLEEFHQKFKQQIKISRYFYRYTGSEDEIDPEYEQELAALGRELYGLLPEAFRDGFPRLVQRVLEKSRGLRLIFEARAGDQADQLLGLPWELLFFEDTRVFLTRSPRVLVVRRLLDTVRSSAMELQSPTRVVHVIAHHPQTDAKYQINAALKQIEKQSISQAVGAEHYIPVDPPGSVEQMLATLQQHSCQIVHFLGHGELQATTLSETGFALPERGYLRFVRQEDYRGQPVTGERLQNVLNFATSVRLVVLNACHGGDNVSRSVALELVYHGMPYVVAIQGQILQEAAGYFAEAFYQELRRGNSIDYAVAVGRAVIAARMPHTMDWCLPVFYTSVGLPEESGIKRTFERLLKWTSHPQNRQVIGWTALGLGGLHGLVGGLMMLSGQHPPLPAPPFAWGGLVPASLLPLISLGMAYRYIQFPPLNSEPARIKRAVFIRALESAVITSHFPVLCSWLLLMLAVGSGFWQLLSSVVQGLLFALLLIPGLLLGGLLGGSQILGHARTLFSDSYVRVPPILDFGTFAIFIGGYGLLFMPWGLLLLRPDWFNLPWGNLIIGGMLCVLGYAILKNPSDP